MKIKMMYLYKIIIKKIIKLIFYNQLIKKIIKKENKIFPKILSEKDLEYNHIVPNPDKILIN